VTLDPRFQRRVVAEMARLERAAHRRSRPRRNDPIPQNTTAPDATTDADRLRRGVLPLPAPRHINPALLKDAEQPAENVQNRIADRITASMAFVYLHVTWLRCWIGFGVDGSRRLTLASIVPDRTRRVVALRATLSRPPPGVARRPGYRRDPTSKSRRAADDRRAAPEDPWTTRNTSEEE
jgi:hypothetical protein